MCFIFDKYTIDLYPIKLSLIKFPVFIFIYSKMKKIKYHINQFLQGEYCLSDPFLQFFGVCSFVDARFRCELSPILIGVRDLCVLFTHGDLFLDFDLEF